MGSSSVKKKGFQVELDSMRFSKKFYCDDDNGFVACLTESMTESEKEDFLRKAEEMKSIGRRLDLTHADKRDIISFLHRLRKPHIGIGDLEHASKMLGLPRLDVVSFCTSDYFTGNAKVKICMCGREFSSLSDDEVHCIACSLGVKR